MMCLSFRAVCEIFPKIWFASGFPVAGHGYTAACASVVELKTRASRKASKS